MGASHRQLHRKCASAVYNITDVALILLSLGLSDITLSLGKVSAIRSLVRRIPTTPVLSSGRTIDEVLSAFNTAAVLYFRTPRCIQRSTALTAILRLHGFAANFTIGCRTMPFFSHAWVEIDGRPINERSTALATLRVIDRF